MPAVPNPHTNPRPHIFTLWFFWTLLAGLTKSVMQLWASWLHRRFSLVKSHLHIVANTERFKQLFSSAHPSCCLRNLCLETLRDASCWKRFMECSQKQKTCKSTAERNNTRIMQKSPPVIMSVPVQTNSDISRQIFLFNRVSKIFGLIWGLNKVFWNTLQPGTRKCGKLNGKPWWQMETYGKLIGKLGNLWKPVELRSKARRKDVKIRSPQLPCIMEVRSIPGHKVLQLSSAQTLLTFTYRYIVVSAHHKGIPAT